MEQQIRFCTTADGVRIAYAAVGSGPLLVRAAHWMTHLEYDWRPMRRNFLDALTARCTLVRYDERGCGLSDWDVATISFEAMVADLESVVDELHLHRFALLGMSQGGPVAIAYTVRHPEKVTRLILHGTYARGWAKRSRAEREEHEAQLAMMKLGWDKDNPAYRQVFASLFMPDATAEQVREFNEWMRLTTSSENAARIQAAIGEIDVMDLAPKIGIPTLVFHSRRDARCPFEEGRRVAALIPNAHFIPLESNNHMPQKGEPAREQMIAEIYRFLGTGQPQDEAERLSASAERAEETFAGNRQVAGTERTLVTVLFADIVGSTQQAVALGDHRWRNLLEDYHTAVRREVDRHGGHEIDTAGDGVLATFETPVQAIRCGCAIRDAVRCLGIKIRIGLHTGECERIGQKLGGIAVHIGARVASHAGADEILVSGTVRDLVAGSGVRFKDRGTRVLKGVPGKSRLFAVEEGEETQVDR